MAQTTNVGHMSAWSLARSRGYTGTREEYAELMASYATVAEQAAESAQSASSSAQGASQAASSANAAMNNALTAESNAQSAASGAQGYAQSAQQSAQSASQSAQNAESAKETAVDAVDGFAAGAQQALESVNSAGINWKSLAEAQALDSEAWALGTRDGEDVGSSDPAYHNNAKYYAESVSASAQAASDAAQTATTKAGEAAASASAAAESARTLTIDATLTQSGQAADSKAVGNAVERTDNKVTNLDGLVADMDFANIIVGEYYYTSGAEIKKSTSTARMRLDYGIALKKGDELRVAPDTGAQMIAAYTDGEMANALGWASSTMIIPEDGVYYLAFKYTDSRTLDSESAKELLQNFSVIRGHGNQSVRNGYKWAQDISTGKRINFFDGAHIINAYIQGNGTFTLNSGNRAAWMELSPNTTYILHSDKKEGTEIAMALFNARPVDGLIGIGRQASYASSKTFSFTFTTTDNYYYLAVKYSTPAAAIYTSLELLESLRLEMVSGENEDVVTSVKNARHVAGGGTANLTICHFSDLHADIQALQRIMTKVKMLGNLVDESICTGDIVSNSAAEIATWWDSSVLTCIGNHDSATYSDGAYNWTALSMADRDAYYIAPFESEWGITHTSGTSYYYKDYADAKIRMIVMDGMLYMASDLSEANTQTAWLENLLADAITNNLHVLIAIHGIHGGATPVECSFTRYDQYTMPTWTDCNTPQAVIDAVASAISNGLIFIGYLAGHTHQDNIWDAEGDKTQLMFCVTCAAVSQTAQWKNADLYRDTNADAFNLVTIDTTNTLVKIVRGGGADIDDHMRTRKAICINYSTGTVVGEVL